MHSSINAVRSRVLFAMVSLALVTACSAATEPITNGTTYVLENIHGAPLPAASGNFPSAQIVTADTLIFLSSDGKAPGRFEHFETKVSGPYTPEFAYGSTYDRREGILVMSWSSCPLFALCELLLVRATGWFGAGTLTVNYESGGWYPRTYRRVN